MSADNNKVPEFLVSDPYDTRFSRLVIYLTLISIAYISVNFAYYFMLVEPMKATQLEIHRRVISGTAPMPIQYRIFTYYIVEGLHRLSGFAIWRVDCFVRFIFTMLSLIFFYQYMRRWFNVSVSFIGSLIVSAVLPVTYVDYIHQPHDIPNFFFTILALALIRDKRESWLVLLMPIAMLNRESFIFVMWAWFFYNIDRIPLKTLIVEFMLFAVMALAVYFALPYYFGPRANYVDTIQIANNMKPIMIWKWFWRLVAFVGPMIIAMSFRFKEKPLFLRRSLGYVAIYMVVNFIIGMYQETRLFLPILPVIIPLGLATIFPARDPDR